MSASELAALVCCDLGAIVRGRSVRADQLGDHLSSGVGWVPANSALTPLGPLAEPNPFGSTGDLRLLPDAATHARANTPAGSFEVILCDIVESNGAAWECCPRSFLREALRQLERELGARVLASFEHEFQLLDDRPRALPFSLEAQRRAEPLPARLMGALAEAGLEPERIFPEFAAHQFEMPVAPAEGLASADRAVLVRELVRDVARDSGTRATFVPLLDPAEAGNGVHIHIALLAADGTPLLYDAGQPAALSELGQSFAAGILRHAHALTALCAASPVSGERLRPHHWSAGAVSLSPQNREALLRIPALVALGGQQPAAQMRLEFRGADASANPYLALGAIVLAGLAGVRERLPAPPLLESDPAALDAEQAERFGVGALPASLSDALAALEADELLRGSMPGLLYDAYVSLKRAELAATAGLDFAERCRRYASVY